ncbi:type IV pilus biogenesis protein PilM [Burkholderia vietnamiensis]|uniref:type IV pilus biogenesis protein PilM n=1 Tax=Burkholderia vietnamiensis TaxID=60552 RepID=UPI001CF2DD60|nr:type IV pilus biogenesis protein PilM [Burkholderia vietnamiensis]MCA8198537.1 type IV pilus biogenesis protein PilM [Burkholderia vietnamiensis]
MVYAAAIGLLVVQFLIQMVLHDRSDTTDALAAASVGDSMVILDNYAAAYAEQHPAFTGAATATMIGLPSWFNAAPFVSSYIQTGHAYTYYTGSVQGVEGYLSQKMQNGYAVGTNNHGVLASATLPAAATATSTIPSAVPSGSVMYMP